jgi:hypothetical protein
LDIIEYKAITISAVGWLIAGALVGESWLSPLGEWGFAVLLLDSVGFCTPVSLHAMAAREWRERKAPGENDVQNFSYSVVPGNKSGQIPIERTWYT